MDRDLKFNLTLPSEKRFTLRKKLNTLSEKINLDLDGFIKQLSDQLIVKGFQKEDFDRQSFIDFLSKILSTGSEVNILANTVIAYQQTKPLALCDLSISRSKVLVLEGSLEILFNQDTLYIEKISFSPRFILN